ncbi:MAG TPA: NfeD family protein [Caulobacter sp.]|nr:NfeD family protein [Caulobacter sp.]
MDALYADHAVWFWLALGAVILVAELSTGTGWMLWPAVTAAVTAVLTLVLPPNIAVHLVIYAVLTIAATLTARRYLPKNISGDGPDINDNVTRLVGLRGEAASIFAEGRGRVHVEGKEWDALSDDPLIPGKAVQVVEVLSAASLRVKAA